MKKIAVLAVLALFLAAPAQAKPKFLGLFWTEPKNFDSPYLENGRHAHPSQWRDRWMVGDWVRNSKEGLQQIQRFYDTQVLTDQYTRDGIPVLEVGSGFYHLSGRDQRRILTLVDTVYGITSAKEPPRVFQIRDWKTNKLLGVYSKAGYANE